MIGILEAILCVLQQMAAAIVGLLVLVVNAAIVALGALGVVVLALLPSMPEPPDPPDGSVIGFINWLFPLSGVAALLVVMGGLFLAFLGLRIILNWVRAL